VIRGIFDGAKIIMGFWGIKEEKIAITEEICPFFMKGD
jgi:hypothetical protein